MHEFDKGVTFKLTWFIKNLCIVTKPWILIAIHVLFVVVATLGTYFGLLLL
jgi:hypothetical protein